MQDQFQSDVNGALEYATVTLPSCDLVTVLQESLQATLDYFQQSSDALDALHLVLFRAWRHKGANMLNFSVSRYERGIQTHEFLRLMDLNGLFERTMSHLYELPHEEALDVLEEFIHSDPSLRYLSYYLRIINAIPDEQQYCRRVDFLTEQTFYDKDKTALTKLATLIDEQKADATTVRVVKLTYLARQLIGSSGIRSEVTRSASKKRRIVIKAFDERGFTPDITKEWQHTRDKQDTNSHERAFILICQSIRGHIQPKRSIEAKELQDNIDDVALKDMLTTMVQKVPSDNQLVSSCKRWCLNVLLEKSSGWKSVLTAMVQFADLWIDEWIQPYAIDTMASLIMHENLLVQYYHHLYKVVYCLPRDEYIKGKVVNLCIFFYNMMLKVTDKEALLTFRDYVYQHMSVQHSLEYNLFDVDCPLIDLDAELAKAFNQCNSEAIVWNSVLQKLAVISIIHPKAVVMEMVSQCCHNKDRHATTIPVLRGLGSLCRTQVKKEGKITTILSHCLDTLLCQWKSYILKDNVTNIATFIATCSQAPNSFETYPPLLVPKRHVREHAEVLLDLEQFLPNNVIPWLRTECSGTLLQLGVETLSMLCSSRATKWNDWSSAMQILNRSDTPVGCTDPLPLARAVSRILDMRSKGLSLQNLENASSFQKKLAHLMAFLYDFQDQEQGAELERFLQEILEDYGWQTYMSWSDFKYEVSLKSPGQKKVVAPVQLESIVNDLGGTCQLFQSKAQDDEKDGWSMLFETCKLSLSFTNQLFAAKDYWMYSLMLLWNHPNDDTLVSEQLYRSLHPSLSPSTMQEYEQLLIIFMGQLYDSFDTAGKAIREHSYRNQGMQKLARLLNDTDAKVFWMVLYMCKLLVHTSESETSKDSDLVYALGITKALNSCHYWTQPFEVSKDPLSLRRFRDRIVEEDVTRMNAAKMWDATQELTDDMDNAMVIDVNYPFMDTKSRSTQALSILALSEICEAFHQVQDQDIHELLRVPMLQIVEGLQDSERRQEFHRLADSQVKSRLTTWKKSKQQKRRGILRPLIDEEHHEFLRSQVLLLDDSALQNVILQSLQLTGQDTATNTVNKKHQAIYCI
ncbi:hypothetical protein BJV82DRAFT_610101 [Fennellomyces sp. T-0311]|nr:hypothetical protein BJV82DRAFT_610101 [Fennellomyces sp. T-0311]